jgi:hypothetical protein
VEFLTPTFQKSELVCEGNPKGQLPPGTSNGQASTRITDIDHAGEDCRQKLDKVHTKIDVFNDIVSQQKAYDAKPKKKKGVLGIHI